MIRDNYQIDTEERRTNERAINKERPQRDAQTRGQRQTVKKPQNYQIGTTNKPADNKAETKTHTEIKDDLHTKKRHAQKKRRRQKTERPETIKEKTPQRETHAREGKHKQSRDQRQFTKRDHKQKHRRQGRDKKHRYQIQLSDI